MVIYRKMKYKLLLITFLALLLFIASPVYADNQDQIDSVVINVDGTFVIVDIVEYGDKYGYDNQLFNYLRGDKELPLVHAIKSGDKFVWIEEYGNNYFGDIGEAIANSDPVPVSEISNYWVLLGFKDDGNPILEDYKENDFPYTATFTVNDIDGAAVEGAMVVIDKSVVGNVTSSLNTPGQWSRVTDADGVATFGVEDGNYTYEVSKGGYITKQGSFIIAEADRSISVTLQTEPVGLGEFKVTKEPYDITDTLYTLAGDGAREFKLWYKDTTGAELNSGVVRVNFYDEQYQEVAAPVTESNITITHGKFVKLTTVAPVIESGEYYMEIKVDYDNDGQFDSTSHPFKVYVGKVGVDGIYETFMSVNNALDAGEDEAYVKLYEDVLENVYIANEDVTLNLNGFTVRNVNIQEEAQNPYIKGSTIDGNLKISWDGIVKVDDSVHIKGNIVFEGVAHNNAQIDGNPTIDGEIVFASVTVKNAGDLKNALMNQSESIFLDNDVIQDNRWGDLEIIYDPVINLRGFTLYLDDQDIVISGGSAEPVIEAGVNGGIKGVNGTERIRVLNEADATIRGAAGTSPAGFDNIMNIEDVDLIFVEPDTELTLSKVHFDEGNSSIVDFDIEGTLNIEEYVTSNDIELTFIGGEFGGNWNSSNNSVYGTVQGDGEINGTGKIVVQDAPNYLFRGYGSGVEDLLTIDIVMDVDIDAGMLEATVDNRNIIFANLELLDTVRLNDNENVIIDNSGGLVNIIGGPGVNEHGEIVGADGTENSDYRVVINRSYLSGTGATNFEDMTLRQVAFNVLSNASISEHSFDDRVFVEVASGTILTAVDNTYVIGSVVEFGGDTNVGTFAGLAGATVHGNGTVLFTAPYNVRGSSWFNFAAEIEVDSDITIEDLALNKVTFVDDGHTVFVAGDLIAFEDNGNVNGRFVGSGFDSTIDVQSFSRLYNLTFTDIERININANTAIEDELGKTYHTSNANVGLDVRYQTDQTTEFNILAGRSLILANTSIRVHDDEILRLNGSGAVRGVGSDGSRFFTNHTGIVAMADNSNLLLHGDRNANLVFDLAVHVEFNSITDLGSVWFSDWVFVNGDATLRSVNNKTADFVKGIDIDTGINLDMLTASITYPLLPGRYVMAVAEDTNSAISNMDNDNIRGTIKGVNGKAEVRGDGWIMLGDLLKVENFTFRDTLFLIDVVSEGTITFADVRFYPSVGSPGIEFLHNTVYLDGDVELVDDVELWFTNLPGFAETTLMGKNNTISGEGTTVFRLFDEDVIKVYDVNFDLDQTAYDYEVVLFGPYRSLVYFEGVSWSNRTTVQVGDGIGGGEAQVALVLRGEDGSIGNHGALYVWNVEDIEKGIQNPNRLLNDNINYYVVTNP